MRRKKTIKQQEFRASVATSYILAKKFRLPVLLLAVIFLAVFVIGNGVFPRGAVVEASVTGTDSRRADAMLENGKKLKLGDKNEMISDIISKLASLGYIESDEPTDLFNAPMVNAVKLFQRCNNMPQTGEIDSLMLNLLYSGTPSKYAARLGNSGEDVKMLQDRLLNLGYYNGAVNGYFGETTQSAVKDFQHLNGLDVTGTVDINTFAKLFSYDAVSGVGQKQNETPSIVNNKENAGDSGLQPFDIFRTLAPIRPLPTSGITPGPSPNFTASPMINTDQFVTYPAIGRTTANYLNFRSQPSTESEIITVLPLGTQVQIIAKNSQWYRVVSGGRFGYLSMTYVTVESMPRPTDDSSLLPDPDSTAVITVYPSLTPGQTALPTAVPTLTPSPTPTAVPTPSQEPFVGFFSDGYINKPYVNFRSQPSTDAEIFEVLTYETQLSVIAKTSEWYRVRYSGRTGYVASPYITMGVIATATPAPTETPTPTPTPKPTAVPTPSVTQDPFTPYNIQGYVNRTSVNFRTGPSTNYSVITSLPYGTVLEVLATNGSWYRARRNGTVGYIYAEYVTKGNPPTPQPTQAPSNGNVESFVSVLKAQLGKPYVSGQQGPNSFDCSGYVYYCLKLCGVNIGRLTAAGYSGYSGWTKVSSFGNLRRGDLMFFYSNDFSRINHTAVYLGDGQLIHSSFSAGKVVISNANSNWYKNHFACGRRVFK